MIDIMLPAFVASLVLIGLHGYLGIHIIARGVIFVDLALAQVAAMGWAAANLGLSGWLHETIGMPEAAAGYAVGVVATLLAAGLFSASRLDDHAIIPQEAIIGIVYVVASAVTILLAAQAPSGSEHVEQLLTGALLWVTWPDIIKTAIVYAIIGAVHWTFRKQFFAISLRPKEAAAEGLSVRKMDFLFYSLFGIVVTLSVAIGGVLIVFSFLVIPAVIAFLFTRDTTRLLIIAWGAGTLATTIGLVASYQWDLPTGPVVVCAFALVLVGAFVVRRIVPAGG